MPKKAQPWSGRFAQPVDEQVKRFTASVSFDRRLAKHDIAASLAHARMLAAQGILAKRDLAAIHKGLAKIAREVAAGTLSSPPAARDGHPNKEKRRTAPAAGNGT